MPEVSVIIPAFNQAVYLGPAIESVINQTFTDLEIIVVDDGSTDSTAAVVNRYADARLEYIYQENQGLSAARNTGIRRATAPLLSFLDADDLFLTEKLSILIEGLEVDPRAGLIAGEAVPIDEAGRHIGKIFSRGFPEDPSELLLGNPLHVGSVLLRRSWQERVGYFDVGLHSYEDWDLWLRLAKIGCPMHWIARPVSLYRFHSRQMTRDGERMTAASLAVLEKIFYSTDLPEKWGELRSLAFSNAYLRAAANSYLIGDWDSAKSHLMRALALNRGLLGEGGRQLADRFSAWTDLPKTSDPLEFIINVYTNVPEHVFSAAQRRREFGRTAIRIAFEAFERKEFHSSRRAILTALRQQPGWIMNRGVISMLVKSTSFLQRYPS